MRTRRLLLAVPMAIVLLLGSACSPEVGDQPAGTAATDGRILPAPDIAVTIYSTPGSGDSGTWVPDFQMRRDGTVFVNGDNRFGIGRYRLSAAGIARVRDLVSAISTDADTYGEVGWTDQGTTGIHINLDGEPRDVDIYGLRGITDPADLRGDVSGGQAEARLALLDTLAALDELGGRAADDSDELIAEAHAPYTPDAFYLELLPAASAAGDPLVVSSEPSDPATTAVDDQGLVRPVSWPLSRPLADLPLRWSQDGRYCVLLRGADAAAIAEVVEQQGVQPRPWSTGATSPQEPELLQLEIRGLLPGVEDSLCDGPETPTHLAVGPLHDVALADPASWDGALDADRFTRAHPLEVYAAVPIIVSGGAATGGDPGATLPELPTGADLTWYRYRIVAADVDGTRHLDISAEVIEGSGRRPSGWRARVDLAAERITEAEVDP